MHREELKDDLRILMHEFGGYFEKDHARERILDEFDRLTDSLTWMRAAVEFERSEKTCLAEALERICRCMKYYSKAGWDYTLKYIEDDGLLSAKRCLETVRDYLDSQQKPKEPCEHLTWHFVDGCRQCAKCGANLEKPKDEEVLRGILSRHSTGHDISGRGYWAIKCKGIEALFAHILDRFQLKESTTTKTVSTWTE